MTERAMAHLSNIDFLTTLTMVGLADPYTG
ncbi:MAG: hypothetical protein QOI38_2441 [Sphingomonadales bacterium]|jgi:hypothetical protein|nr:hypothetical protein [Sphingomonadales bacterium]